MLRVERLVVVTDLFMKGVGSMVLGGGTVVFDFLKVGGRVLGRGGGRAGASDSTRLTSFLSISPFSAKPSLEEEIDSCRLITDWVFLAMEPRAGGLFWLVEEGE